MLTHGPSRQVPDIHNSNWISINRDAIPKAGQENQVDALKSLVPSLVGMSKQIHHI